MTWDITKAKFYGQIMDSLAEFFGNKEATEAEIHDALQGQKPLAEQLEAARTGNELAGQLQMLTERVGAMEAEQATLRADIESRDAQIAEMQAQVSGLEAQITAKETEIAALKAEHQKKVNELAGQVSSLKAGKSLEQEQGGEPHEAAKSPAAKAGFVEIASDKLQKMVANNRKA